MREGADAESDGSSGRTSETEAQGEGSMSEDIDEMIDDIHLDDGELSDCCGAPIYPDTDICSECGEHC